MSLVDDIRRYCQTFTLYALTYFYKCLKAVLKTVFKNRKPGQSEKLSHYYFGRLVPYFERP